MTRSLRTLALGLALACLPACKYSREGWGGGRFYVLMEELVLQMRRSKQVVDPANGDVVAAWIGARTPPGAGRILRCELTLYVDENGNEGPDPDEVLVHRLSREPAVKILFDDIRISAADAARPVDARIHVHTERKVRMFTWRFEPD